MIGEIRDFETAQIAIQASLTGHLVLATVHTNDAPSTVNRLIDMGVEPFLLSSSLLGVLAQRLVRKLCEYCKREDEHHRWHPVGCEHCGNSGYKGRTGVYELLVVDDDDPGPDPRPRGRARRDQGRRRQRHALDARGRRAAGGRRRHVARRSRARDARLTIAAPMPAYKYEALDANGKSSNGIVEAEIDEGRALAPARAAAGAAGPDAGGGDRVRRAARRRFTRKAFSSSGLAVWTRQLAGLVAAGLPLERALTALGRRGRGAAPARPDRPPAQRGQRRRARSRARSAACRASSTTSTARVVAAGEQSGALGRVLERLADDLEERQALKGKLIGAALYPAIVSVIAVIIVTFLVTYVVPQVASVFASSKHALPFLTEMMLAISAFVRQWGLLVAALLVLRRHPVQRGAAPARRSGCASTPPSSTCRWPAASRAATTRRASPARSRCSPAPACRS